MPAPHAGEVTAPDQKVLLTGGLLSHANKESGIKPLLLGTLLRSLI